MLADFDPTALPIWASRPEFISPFRRFLAHAYLRVQNPDPRGNMTLIVNPETAARLAEAKGSPYA